MHAEDLVLHQTSDWQAVEATLDQLEDLWAELDAKHFVASVQKAILLVHRSVLVVATDQPNAVGKQNLEGEQEANHLHLVSAPIHKVAIEDPMSVIVLTRRTKREEDEQKVSQLAMDVSKDLAWRFRDRHRRLQREQLRRHIGDQHQSIKVLRTEQIGDQGRVVPFGVEAIRLFGQLFRQHAGLLHDHPRPVLHSGDHPVRRRRTGAANLEVLMPQDLVFQGCEIEHLRVQHPSNQGRPFRDDLGVRRGELTPQESAASPRWRRRGLGLAVRGRHAFHCDQPRAHQVYVVVAHLKVASRRHNLHLAGTRLPVRPTPLVQHVVVHLPEAAFTCYRIEKLVDRLDLDTSGDLELAGARLFRGGGGL
mmetsp:Transcript_106640/g.308545  ORF Transcript_106640/g.308545 Transcript_106640/m.308545 type:complete len:364 (-) Transcript_106640:688-1779(-)